MVEFNSKENWINEFLEEKRRNYFKNKSKIRGVREFDSPRGVFLFNTSFDPDSYSVSKLSDQTHNFVLIGFLDKSEKRESCKKLYERFEKENYEYWNYEILD